MSSYPKSEIEILTKEAFSTGNLTPLPRSIKEIQVTGTLSKYVSFKDYSSGAVIFSGFSNKNNGITTVTTKYVGMDTDVLDVKIATVKINVNINLSSETKLKTISGTSLENKNVQKMKNLEYYILFIIIIIFAIVFIAIRLGQSWKPTISNLEFQGEFRI